MWLDEGMNNNVIRPNLTPEVVDQLRAFNEGEIFAVVIVKDVKTRAGNILIGKGHQTWGMRNEYGGMTVWTGHTHYAGVKSSSVRPNSVKIAAAAV